MKIYVALLRGINVGGRNIIPMAKLKLMCEGIGFKNVSTYIQSGNVVFQSELSEKASVKALEEILEKDMGKRIPVIMRSQNEFQQVIKNNPFPKANPAQVGVTFFSEIVQKSAFEGFTIDGPEELKISGREIFVHYPIGMGKSKLKLPKSALNGTVRNINTVNKLIGLCQKLA